jgi:hypothetical protein
MEHHLPDVPSLENQLAGQQPVADTPERMQVNPMIGVGDAEQNTEPFAMSGTPHYI